MLPTANDPIVTPEEALARIVEARPDLHPVSLAHLGRGWDHDVYLANQGWVVRFPRNGVAALALQLEASLLPWLAPALPIAIPVPVWHGPDQIAHALIPGRTIVDAALRAEERGTLAPALASFLRALHAVPPATAPVTLPQDPLGRLDASRRAPKTLELIHALDDLAAEERRLFGREIETAPARPPEEPLAIVHADLHGRNLLVQDGSLSGVIDWVDVHLGHRAVDLAVMYEVLPARSREVFLASYGEVSSTALAWARWRAIDHLVRSASGAHERGDQAFSSAALQALRDLARNV